MELLSTEILNMVIEQLTDCDDRIAACRVKLLRGDGNVTACTEDEVDKVCFPAVVPQLNAQVTMLNFSDQNLQKLPRKIGNCVALQKLWVYNNQLTSLPTQIGNCVELGWLDLRNNPLPALLPQLPFTCTVHI